MNKRTLFLALSVMILPINSYIMLGSDTDVDLTASTVNITTNVPQITVFSLDEDVASEEKQANLIDEFTQKFNYINKEAIIQGLKGYAYLCEHHKVNNSQYLTIVDFSKASTEERLFIIDVKKQKLVLKSLVAHGKNSGDNYATKFSNEPSSYQSSLGFYVTAETYNGSKGYSLRLDGLEANFNSNARSRGVVVHGANYVSKAFAQANGRLGRSQGCPALPIETNQKIINIVKGGSCFFIYHPTNTYEKQSAILKKTNETTAMAVLDSLQRI
ncbi:MAG: murein L,D-transpeptidase catalytic domain family protein [Chitinophagales bacterium]